MTTDNCDGAEQLQTLELLRLIVFNGLPTALHYSCLLFQLK